MLRREIEQLLPRWAQEFARALWRRVLFLARAVQSQMQPLVYFGRGRWCPVCEKDSRKFRSFGISPRKDAQCFHCGALERHRFVWLFFSRMTNLFDGTLRQVLHAAPESCFTPRLKQRLGNGYLTADLMNPGAMVRMDITSIQYPDNHFDIIYCSHVLEHVEDDRRAIRELHRVLKPGGWAILLVPITTEKTFEDRTIVDPAERLRVFGQHDHVRRYGWDYVDRLCDAGFSVKISRVRDLFDANEAVQMGLTPASGEIFYCTKG